MSKIILTTAQSEEIKSFIQLNHYSFSIEEIVEEYEKFKDFDYVSHSFKKVFEKYNQVFKRENSC